MLSHYTRPHFPPDQPLVHAINWPTERTAGNAVYIGPTAVTFDMGPPAAGERPRTALLPASEPKLIARWKAQDLERFYREQRSNRR